MGFLGLAGHAGSAGRAFDPDGVAQRGAADGILAYPPPEVSPQAGVNLGHAACRADFIQQIPQGGQWVVLEKMDLDIELALPGVFHAVRVAVCLECLAGKGFAKDRVHDLGLRESATEFKDDPAPVVSDCDDRVACDRQGD